MFPHTLLCLETIFAKVLRTRESCVVLTALTVPCPFFMNVNHNKQLCTNTTLCVYMCDNNVPRQSYNQYILSFSREIKGVNFSFRTFQDRVDDQT